MGYVEIWVKLQYETKKKSQVWRSGWYCSGGGLKSRAPWQRRVHCSSTSWTTSVLHERESISLALLCKIMQRGSVAPIIQLVSQKTNSESNYTPLAMYFQRSQLTQESQPQSLTKPLFCAIYTCCSWVRKILLRAKLWWFYTERFRWLENAIKSRGTSLDREPPTV